MKNIIVVGVVITIGLVWIVAWGDFDEWHYSKNLNCGELQNPRKEEICKSLEKYQEYTFFGHAMISAGYRSTYATIKNSWCELSLNEADLERLKAMESDYKLSPPLIQGSGMLYSLLDANLNKDSIMYSNSMYSPTSPNYLIKDGCLK